uniref:Uncharacterized protein n=1 Tax=Oryza glaberrima TaxID=4538 RepID=I1PWF3_ORYGL
MTTPTRPRLQIISTVSSGEKQATIITRCVFLQLHYIYFLSLCSSLMLWYCANRCICYFDSPSCLSLLSATIQSSCSFLGLNEDKGNGSVCQVRYVYINVLEMYKYK